MGYSFLLKFGLIVFLFAPGVASSGFPSVFDHTRNCSGACVRLRFRFLVVLLFRPLQSTLRLLASLDERQVLDMTGATDLGLFAFGIEMLFCLCFYSSLSVYYKSKSVESTPYRYPDVLFVDYHESHGRPERLLLNPQHHSNSSHTLDSRSKTKSK